MEFDPEVLLVLHAFSDIKTRAVVQQYVPKLLHVQKSLIRVKVFVLVTSASPLRVHMHEEGSVYFMRPETYGFSKVISNYGSFNCPCLMVWQIDTTSCWYAAISHRSRVLFQNYSSSMNF